MTAGSASSAQAATGTVTILPVLRDGKPNDALTQGTTDRLLRLGEEPETARGSLSMAEQGCGTTSCLGTLAQRLHAARIVGGAVVAGGQRRYTAKVFLYDSGTGRILNEEKACDDCGERQLNTLVASLAAKLVELSPPSAARSPGPSVPAGRSPEPALVSVSDRRQGEVAESAKGQTVALAKAREAAESAARSGEANGKLLDNVRIAVDRTRESQDRLRETTDKTREAADRVRAATDKIRAEVERSRDSSDKAKESAERTRETVERTRDLAERARASADRAQELAQATQVAVERLRQSVDKARESSESGRSGAEATRLQTEKLAPVVMRAAVAAESARAESALAREASTQASSVSGKTLASIDQLNTLSTDLRSALTNVEPLRAAAEQTQETAQVNAAKSADLLKLVESQRASAENTLLQAERTLRLLKEQQARRGLSRKRKVAAGVLGGLTVLTLGASITMLWLDEPCTAYNAMSVLCGNNFSPRYTSIGFTVSALLGASMVAVLAVPSSSGG